MKLFQKQTLSLFVSLMTILVSVYILLIYSAQFSSVTGVCCDASAWIAAADAQVHGYGQPYTNYWDIKPPGLILVTASWIYVFGTHIISLKALDLLVAAAVAVLILQIYKKLFPWWLAHPFAVLTLLPLYSSSIQTQFLSSEMLGLLVSLAGLHILLDSKLVLSKKLIFASFLFVLSGQVKDPFLPTLLAVLPFIISSFKNGGAAVMRTCLFVVSGIVLSTTLILGYLLLSGSLNDYMQVLQYKQAAFSVWETEKYLSPLIVYMQRAAETFIQLQYAYIFLVFIACMLYPIRLLYKKNLLINANKSTRYLEFKINFSAYAWSKTIVLAYSLGSIIGFAMQGKLGFHYYIQIVPVIFFVSSILLESIRTNLLLLLSVKNTQKIITVASLLVFIFLLPKKEYLREYLQPSEVSVLLSKDVYTTPAEVRAFQEHVWEQVSSDECVFSVYGWAMGQHYATLKRRPCSQYFILNILTDEQKRQLANDLETSPPKFIQYSQGGADMDIVAFESEYFDFTRVLSTCYTSDSVYENMFLARFNSEEQQRCIRENK